jgi:hypothetical protein
MRMDWQLVWFLLAGFVLGFATSTLWEWVYYRGLRRRNLASVSPPAVVAARMEQPVTMAPLPTSAEAPPDALYRSPAVFIEGEQDQLDQPASHQPTYEPVTTPNPERPLPSVDPLESTSV